MHTVQQAVDRTTYNVKDDPERGKSTALEMLRKVPVVSTGLNDDIEVNGRKTYVILINGKQSAAVNRYPATMLRNLMAGRVDKIEEVTTSPAKFSQNGVTEVIKTSLSLESSFRALRILPDSITTRLTTFLKPLPLSTTQGDGD